MILDTERLYLRRLEQSDFDALCLILQDEETMYAYEGAFTDEAVRECHYGIIISNSKNRITMGFLRLFQTQFNQSSL